MGGTGARTPMEARRLRFAPAQATENTGSEVVDESAGARLRGSREVDPAQPPFFEPERRLGAGTGEQEAGKGREAGLVTHEQNCSRCRQLGDVLDQIRRRGAGCERGEVAKPGSGPESRGHDAGRLFAPHQRAAQDQVESQPKEFHPL